MPRVCFLHVNNIVVNKGLERKRHCACVVIDRVYHTRDFVASTSTIFPPDLPNLPSSFLPRLPSCRLTLWECYAHQLRTKSCNACRVSGSRVSLHILFRFIVDDVERYAYLLQSHIALARVRASNRGVRCASLNQNLTIRSTSNHQLTYFVKIHEEYYVLISSPESWLLPDLLSSFFIPPILLRGRLQSTIALKLSLLSATRI